MRIWDLMFFSEVFMRRVKFCIGVGLIFVLGAMSGFFLSRQVTYQKVRRFVREGPPPIVVMKKIVERIDLQPEQRRAIDRVLDELRGEMMEFHDGTLAEGSTILWQGFQRIQALLPPAQREALIHESEHLTRRWTGARNWRLPWAEMGPDEVMAELTNVLSLSDEQQQLLRPLVVRRVLAQQFHSKDFVSQLDERDALYEAMLREGRSADMPMRDILSPEQFKVYLQYRIGKGGKPSRRVRG